MLPYTDNEAKLKSAAGLSNKPIQSPLPPLTPITIRIYKWHRYGTIVAKSLYKSNTNGVVQPYLETVEWEINNAPNFMTNERVHYAFVKAAPHQTELTLTAPQSRLTPDTTYWVKTCHHDSNGAIPEWPTPVKFMNECLLT